MIHWKNLPTKYRRRTTTAPTEETAAKRKNRRCKVFPKGMGAFIRELSLNENGKYVGTDEPL